MFEVLIEVVTAVAILFEEVVAGLAKEDVLVTVDSVRSTESAMNFFRKSEGAIFFL